MVTYSQFLKYRAKVWLIIAMVFCGLWVYLWLHYDNKAQLAIKKTLVQNTPDYIIPTKIEELGELSNLVAPIDFQTITRDLRNYPDEFKDKKYFEKYRSKWTVQVMDVVEHKVITDYLDNQSSRDKFAYFRYTDEKGMVRYVLTYGVMSSFQEAMGASKVIDFKLPNSTRVIPEEMRRYADMIDNYERANTYNDDIKTVRLTKAVKEVPVEPVQQLPKKQPKQTPVKIDEVVQSMADAPSSKDIKVAPTAKPVRKNKPAEQDNKPKETKSKLKADTSEASPAAHSAEEL